MATAQFIIIEESLSGHCCFEYTIVDTQQGKVESGGWKGRVCECVEKDYAEMICKALNLCPDTSNHQTHTKQLP
jgi:hypothetical protein